jgi:hypothetical protein
MPPDGAEYTRVFAGHSHILPQGGAESGAVSADPRLLAVIAAWLDLSPAARGKIIAITEGKE